MNSRPAILIITLLLAGISQPLLAIQVYQWTDENGVVHFSQWEPEEEQADVETVSVDGGQGAENGLGISEEDDPEGYQAHREQMDALWAEREARREAERKRQAQASRTEFIYLQPENGYSYGYPFYYPGYGQRPPNRPGRPPQKPVQLPEPVGTTTLKRP